MLDLVPLLLVGVLCIAPAAGAMAAIAVGCRKVMG